MKKEVCSDCGKHNATITFSEGGVIGWTHGMTTRLCLCCYHKRVAAGLKEVQKNYVDVDAQLKKEGCK